MSISPNILPVEFQHQDMLQKLFKGSQSLWRKRIFIDGEYAGLMTSIYTGQGYMKLFRPIISKSYLVLEYRLISNIETVKVRDVSMKSIYPLYKKQPYTERDIPQFNVRGKYDRKGQANKAMKLRAGDGGMYLVRKNPLGGFDIWLLGGVR